MNSMLRQSLGSMDLELYGSDCKILIKIIRIHMIYFI
ncbi:hypothetical protein CPT_Madawaska_205 [Staphylococcus phage Madawaska]|nr:hypothetical protein CPT_Madawaska_205 [Staphylococcus phage Madawaska]